MKNKINPASVIAMVRPAAFGFNEETAENNFFQDATQKDNHTLQEKALAEFDAMVLLLRNNGVDVLVLEDNISPVKPDAVFPNNWFSCNDNAINIFPMCAKNRRPEKRTDLIDQIRCRTGINNVNDLSSSEADNIFLEGTGSMIIDHINRIIYACISVRTNKELLLKYASENNYEAVVFEATDETGREIYHTNVMMCIGYGFAVVCADAIKEENRTTVLQRLSATGHVIIEISFGQMNSFVGNMLQLMNDKEEKLLVMSLTAYNSFNAEQITVLEKYSRLIVSDVSSIEAAAGGSVRCMMAELFF